MTPAIAPLITVLIVSATLFGWNLMKLYCEGGR